MSYGNQNTDWNNDSNKFSNTTGDREFGDDSYDQPISGTGFERGVGPQSTQQFQPRDDAFAGAYAGNTTDVNTPGAGGDFTGGETRRPLGDQDWDDNSGRQQAYQGDNSSRQQGYQGDYSSRQQGYQGDDNDNTATSGKASMGDRVKGTAEKWTGKLTGNANMAERGQERKEGDFERDY